MVRHTYKHRRARRATHRRATHRRATHRRGGIRLTPSQHTRRIAYKTAKTKIEDKKEVKKNMARGLLALAALTSSFHPELSTSDDINSGDYLDTINELDEEPQELYDTHDVSRYHKQKYVERPARRTQNQRRQRKMYL